MLAYGAPAAIRPASSAPIPRIEARPSRTAVAPARPGSSTSVAAAALAFTSGRSVATPWRRASATRLSGDQNPIGWEFKRAARNAAG